MSQVEVFTGLHAYPISIAIFVHDYVVLIKAAMLTIQFLTEYSFKENFKECN